MGWGYSFRVQILLVKRREYTNYKVAIDDF